MQSQGLNENPGEAWVLIQTLGFVLGSWIKQNVIFLRECRAESGTLAEKLQVNEFAILSNVF
jgi:hypothetical protein